MQVVDNQKLQLCKFSSAEVLYPYEKKYIEKPDAGIV
jgi:hypothetical protein